MVSDRRIFTLMTVNSLHLRPDTSAENDRKKSTPYRKKSTPETVRNLHLRP